MRKASVLDFLGYIFHIRSSLGERPYFGWTIFFYIVPKLGLVESSILYVWNPLAYASFSEGSSLIMEHVCREEKKEESMDVSHSMCFLDCSENAKEDSFQQGKAKCMEMVSVTILKN